MLSTHAGAPTNLVVRELPRVRAAQLADRVEGLRPGLVSALLGRRSVVASDLPALRAVGDRVTNGHPLDLQAMESVLKARKQYDLYLDDARQDGVDDDLEKPQYPSLQGGILGPGERQLIVDAAERLGTEGVARPGTEQASRSESRGHDIGGR